MLVSVTAAPGGCFTTVVARQRPAWLPADVASVLLPDSQHNQSFLHFAV
jgi:hypothetical protein